MHTDEALRVLADAMPTAGPAERAALFEVRMQLVELRTVRAAAEPVAAAPGPNRSLAMMRLRVALAGAR